MCDACRPQLPYVRGDVCRRCALRRPSPLPEVPRCRGCAEISSALHSVRAVFIFEGAVRRAVHVLKFRGGRYLVPTLAALIDEELQRRPVSAELVIPVPISPRRLRDRGFNQAELLARPLAARLGVRLGRDVLVRADRPPQSTLDAQARRRNLQGAIRCRVAGGLGGRSVLLVDDVMTTGATLSVCADALLDAGAGAVRGLVFARDL